MHLRFAVLGFRGCALARRAGFVGRLPEQRGEHVTLLPTPGAPPPRSRPGKPHLLPIRQSAFTHVISARKRHAAHPGLLEVHAARLGLEWLCRSPAKFGKRVCMLIDTRAILGAVAKGRTSARSVRMQISRIDALSLASDTTSGLYPF